MASNSLIPPYIQTNANNLSYGLGGEVPPEIALEEQALNRKQQIANLLFQRGMQSPQGQMVGRFYVAPNPMQGVAQLANVLAGGYITHRNDEARKGLAEKNRSMTADAIQAYMDNTSPKAVTGEAHGPGAPEFDMTPSEALSASPMTADSIPGNLNEPMPDGMTLGENLDDLYLKRAKPYYKEGPRPTGVTYQEPTEEMSRKALIGAMSSQIPGLRQFATLDSQMKAAKLEHEATRNQAIALELLRQRGAKDLHDSPSGNAKLQAIDQVTTIGPNGEIVPNQAAINAKEQIAAAGAAKSQTIVNSYTPASEEAQKKFMDSSKTSYDALKLAPQALENIEKAKQLIPAASGFMGPGGETMLEAAKFLNNRLGLSIDTEGIKSAEELRSRIFFNIMDSLKKMDAQPSELQQKIMQESLGKLGTDPSALPGVLDAFADAIRGKVGLYNKEVEGAQRNGVKFPYDPIIQLPEPAKAQPNQAGAPQLSAPPGWSIRPLGAEPSQPVPQPQPAPQQIDIDKIEVPQAPQFGAPQQAASAQSPTQAMSDADQHDTDLFFARRFKHWFGVLKDKAKALDHASEDVRQIMAQNRSNAR